MANIRELIERNEFADWSAEQIK
ncbi:MAG: hypothetical protein ACYSYL_15795 [Planctomycetota bacterium]